VVEVPSIFHDWLRSMFKDRIRVERQKGALDFSAQEATSRSAVAAIGVAQGFQNDLAVTQRRGRKGCRGSPSPSRPTGDVLLLLPVG
jgi:hypothetical protein